MGGIAGRLSRPRVGTYPTAEAALDAAVTALRDAGLMEERHE
jgi:hypothetical protein